MGSGFAKKKKEARAFRESFQEMQEKLKNTEVVGTAGSGLVTVTLTGEHVCKSIKIKKECIDPDDAEGLEDLICAAYNEAAKKLEKESLPDMPGMTGMPNFSSLGL